MASPEIQPQTPPVVEIPNAPEQTPAMESIGVVVTPHQPSVPQPQAGQVPLATPVPAPLAPTGPAVTIPMSVEALQDVVKHEDPDNARYGLLVLLIRKAKIAFKNGIRVVIGGSKSNV